jgi:DNA polymerase
MKLTIDFETRSRCNLKKRGAWVYSEDPSTTYICLAVKVDGGVPRLHYNPQFCAKGDLTADQVWTLIQHADEIEAHNAPFEIAIWHNVCFKRMGWPDLPLEKMRDSAAKCRMCGLPAGLEAAGAALGLSVQKDRAGHLLMMQMCKPRKPSKNNPNEWIEDADSLNRLGAYCKKDCDAEHCLSGALPDLSPEEQKVWLWDQKVNLRGIPVDTLFAGRAIEMLDAAEKSLLAEFRLLTNGKVMSPRQVAQMLKLLEEHECEMEKLDKKAVAKMLKKSNLDPTAERMLQIRAALGKSSVAKYQTLLGVADSSNRIRQSMIYHGAGTGRWTGKGFQPQNLPKGDFTDTDQCVTYILDRDYASVELWYGGVQGAAATCIRSAIKATEGMDFIAADLSAIEPRVTAWFAGAKRVLEGYRAGRCGYRSTYSHMFKIAYEAVTTPQRNKIGKPCVLAFGFGGSVAAMRKFISDETMEEEGWTDETLKEFCTIWRDANPEIVKAWGVMFRAAKDALANPGQVFWILDRKLAFCVQGRFLVMRLPSGRKLYYCDPHMADRGKGWDELCFWGVDAISKKWCRQNLYGGKLMENAVQAASRDILVNNMMRLDVAYPIVFHVHDEAISMVPQGQGSVKEFEAELSRQPAWAKDIPLAAEGWRGERYRK